MAVPYVDYFEHTMDMGFLREWGYPFLKPQAEFYASCEQHACGAARAGCSSALIAAVCGQTSR